MPTIRYDFIADLVVAELEPGATVLELGCGAKQYRPSGARYVGLDLPGSAWLRDGPDVAADAQRLPFASRSFDLVFAVASLYLMPDAGAALAEAHRVLHPGGRLLVVDYQQRVLERLRTSHTPAQHSWAFDDLAARVRDAGFAFGVQDLSGEPLRRRYCRLDRWIVRNLRRRGRGADTWLVVDARA